MSIIEWIMIITGGLVLLGVIFLILLSLVGFTSIKVSLALILGII